MSKYIIKNCPAISFTVGCLNEEVKVWDCQDCTDCVMKQIVELCKDIKKDHYWGMREIRFSQEILELLDIQEVE